jgi:hypothetical protein
MKQQRGSTPNPSRQHWHRLLDAFHEAGHAVVGHIIGRCIAEVSIVREKQQGYCVFNAFAEDTHGFPQWHDGSKNPECTTILYAGTVAMAILCEQRGWQYERWRGSDRADFDLIALWSLERFAENEEQAHAMQQACRKQAERILRQHWQAVAVLASALLAQETVIGNEAHRIIQHVIDATVTDWRMGTWHDLVHDLEKS